MVNKDYNKLKNDALKLRKKGLSYNEIKNTINVSKSTLSLWLKSIRLNERDRRRLYTKQIAILSRGAQSQKERRKREVNNIIESAEKEISGIDNHVYKFFGAALYWAEGSKTKSFEITNSDPHLILFMVKWFKMFFGIKPRNLKARLNIYSQQNEANIKKFWSNITDIPGKNFTKSYIKPQGKGFKKNNLYYGTIKIYVPKGTDLRHKTFGWTKAVLRPTAKHVELIQKKWESLEKNSRPINLEEHP